MIFGDKFEALIRSFNASSVEYMIVGGYAVNFHGYNRNTSDLDVWVSPEIENKTAICNALSLMKFEEIEIKRVMELNFEKPFLFHVGSDPNDIEVFNFVTGVSYQEAKNHKVSFDFGNKLVVNFISIQDLIVNKLLSGRLKDKLDVEELQKIQKLRNT